MGWRNRHTTPKDANGVGEPEKVEPARSLGEDPEKLTEDAAKLAEDREKLLERARREVPKLREEVATNLADLHRLTR